MRRPLAVLAVSAAVLLAPVAADAATRFAAPTGTGPEPCAEAAPCALTAALGGGLADGDTVILLGRATGAASSLYDLTALPGRVGVTIARSNVTVTAREDGVTIRSNSLDETVRAFAGGVVLRRLVLQNVCGSAAPLDPAPADCTTGFPAYALRASSATVERVFAYSSQRRACGLINDATVANTVCLSLNGGNAIDITSTSDAPQVTLTNVTARSRFYPAIDITHQRAGACTGASVTIVNSIVSASATFAAPLWANPDGTANPCPIALTLRASSVPTRNVGMSVTQTETGPVSESPTYSDALKLVPKASSPTVNRGSTTAADLARAGTLDVASRDRVQGPRIDLGAYEYGEGVLAPTVPVDPADPVDPAVPGDPAVADPGASATLSVVRPRATARARAIVVRGRIIASTAGVVTRTVARVQGKRRITICRSRQQVKAGSTTLRCATKPAARALLRRRAMVLVVTTRFLPAGETTSIVDRQNLRVRRG